MKNVPSSIYRLQLTEQFTIKKATELLPYLKALGFEGVYCSPYFAASSSHGYDIYDSNRFNPLLGTVEEYETFCQKLKELNLFHLADVVPNHMGIKNNIWFQDVLEKGQRSVFAKFFDIDWSKGKLFLPLLGMPYDEVLKKKKLKIVRRKGGLVVQYEDQFFPLNPQTYSSKTPYRTTNEIDALLQKQHYRLVHWKMASQEISYRRFFNINELIGLRIESPEVLAAHHRWIFELLKQKKVDGLRIDHPDGLYDPEGYLNALRKQHKGLMVLEKILGWKEELPLSWKVEGTVGYEFLNMLTGAFVKSDEGLTEVYFEFIGKPLRFEMLLYVQKKFYLQTEMGGDVKNLTEKLYRVSSKMRSFTDVPKEDIHNALCEFLAFFPVYRSYIRLEGPVPQRDRPYIQKALKEARAKNRELGSLVFDLLEDVFSLKIDTPDIRDFILRFQQLSAPVMAKGYEDITLYQFNRLLALNEVGGFPERLGVTKEEFHDFCRRKKENWPYGFLSNSTHDTKRSHDARMQLAVLSEIPEKWAKALQKWSKLNTEHKTKIGHDFFPDTNAEYFLYQTLLAVWPSRPSFKRIWQSFLKSIREARTYTSWRHPNEAYEKACEQFVKALFNKKNSFLRSFVQFQKQIEEYGKWNSLSSIALQMGGPGIVDVYEGCENFRFTLVDPDNRTPVDFDSPENEKRRLHRTALQFRNRHKALFLEGEYIPLKVEGPREEHVIAFLRSHRKKTCLIASLRFFASLKNLRGTYIILPKKMREGIEVFSDRSIEGSLRIPISKLFQKQPYAWLFWKNN